MSKKMSKKKIIWITADHFIDVDLPIIPYLVTYYDITWLIVESGSNTIDYHRIIEDKIHGLPIKIEYIKIRSRIRNIKIIFEYISLFRRVKNQRVDLIYFDFDGFPYFNFFFYKFFNQKKTIVAIHNVSTPKGAVNYSLAKRYTNFTLSKFKNIQVFSLSQLSVLNEKFKNKNVLYAPLALKDFGKSSLKPNEKITFLCFGLIREYKRVDVLINAAQKAYEETKKTFLVKIAGNCNHWEKYQKLIKYDFLFDLRIDRVPNEDIPDLFAYSHYFVLPYQDIAQSGALTVGLNYNLPVIVSELPAFKEFVMDKETGFFMKIADVESLKNIIVHVLMNHDEIYSTLKNNQQKFVEENLSLESIIEKYRNYFNQLIYERY